MGQAHLRLKSENTSKPLRDTRSLPLTDPPSLYPKLQLHRRILSYCVMKLVRVNTLKNIIPAVY